MILFTFVYEDSPIVDRKKIEIDEDLFVRIARDDMEALDDLYAITERTMYAFALSLTKDHEKSLDLIQDTYIKILSSAHLYKPMGKPLAWMFTIAKNLFYTNTKKEKRSISIQPEDLSDDRRFSYISDIDDRLVLEGVLSLLNEEERQIVILHAVSGMKHREISEGLGMKLSTCLSKYRRALKKLRTYIDAKEVRA